MPLSTYSPGNKFAPTFTDSVGEQVKKERADRIAQYGSPLAILKNRLELYRQQRHKNMMLFNFRK